MAKKFQWNPAPPPRQEFERKFLVLRKRLPERLPEPVQIVQGYLAFEPISVRIRITDDHKAVLELKGGKDKFESSPLELPIDEARYALSSGASRIGSLIVKQRHALPAAYDGLKWEIDFFQGKNDGLILAEIEIPTPTFVLDGEEMPAWIGKEVTDDKRFKNKNLAQRPFSSWPARERKKILELMSR